MNGHGISASVFLIISTFMTIQRIDHDHRETADPFEVLGCVRISDIGRPADQIQHRGMQILQGGRRDALHAHVPNPGVEDDTSTDARVVSDPQDLGAAARLSHRRDLPQVHSMIIL